MRQEPGEAFYDYDSHRLLDRSASDAPGLPRLLAGIPARGALALREHLALHGELPAIEGRGRSRRGAAAGLIDEIERAGLLGRGGAGFPTAAKLRAVAGASRSGLGRAGPIVVVNGAEGEPASAKDRTLLRSLPHLVLDGAQLAAAAVGARQVLLGVCEYSPSALDAVARALDERGCGRGEPVGGVQIPPSPRPPPLRRRPRVGARQPPLRRPRAAHVYPPTALRTGRAGAPHVGLQRRDPRTPRADRTPRLQLVSRLGTPEQPGSALVTLAGSVAAPGVYEIEHGSPLTALLDAADGLTAQPRAVLLGGYSGTWIDGSHLREVALSDPHLSPFGASLGAGVVVVLSAEACPVAELARLTRWLASQSARQCGPCVFGLDAVASVFEQLAGGAGDRLSRDNRRVEDRSRRQGARDRNGRDAIDQRLHSLAGLVRGRGACSHPDGVARLVSSALDVFAQELSDHAHHGPCAACARPSELPRPRVSRPAAPGSA